MIGVKEDDAKRIDNNGMSESQVYEFSRNDSGPAKYFKKDKAGKFRAAMKNEKGNLVFTGGGNLIVGRREKYYDFSF